jgi:hypothetical protein
MGIYDTISENTQIFHRNIWGSLWKYSNQDYLVTSFGGSAAQKYKTVTIIKIRSEQVRVNYPKMENSVRQG